MAQSGLRADEDNLLEIRVGPPTIVVHADTQVVVSAPDASINPQYQQGFFEADTRLISRYALHLNGLAPILLNSAATSAHAARYEFTNAEDSSSAGDIPSHVLHLRVDRLVGDGVHEDLDLVSYHQTGVDLILEISIESDFADLFDVKSGATTRRGTRRTRWTGTGLDAEYRNGDFCRGLRIQIASSTTPPEYADGRVWFRAHLEPRSTWHACMHWMPFVDNDNPSHPAHDCHDLVAGQSKYRTERQAWRDACTRFDTDNDLVNSVVARATDDLASLRIRPLGAREGSEDPATWMIAAGVPWFVTLFGRDSLIVALQTMALSPKFALGTLRALGKLQGATTDDWRDLQPGKIEHEIRHGELAYLHLTPQVPYYGSHDATTLYVVAAARSFHWHGDRQILDALRPNVEHALEWIDRFGDLDDDGLQEYQTHSRQGMYNQAWKDSGEAIVHADGTNATLPIATCELQGYVVAAKRAWADILSDVYGEHERAGELRDAASRLVEALESRFWWADEGTYYLGLDGKKQPIESVTSNPGHLLWSEAVGPERAARVATRLLEADMWSGWGVRTLSEAHRAYNPFSYQRGAVWPHDNAILVEGMCRYGHYEQAAKVANAIFDAANCFQHRRLPELFAGLTREAGGFPAQYLGANVPQAWASGAPIQMLTAFLGAEPDAPAGLLRLDPHLPEWLSSVRVANLGVGQTTVDLTVSGAGGTRADIHVEVHRKHPRFRVERRPGTTPPTT